MTTPKFAHSSLSLHSLLKERINAYFDENKISPTGNFSLYFKSVVLIAGYLALYAHLVFWTPAGWLAVLECILLSALTAGIGFNIMHDGSHGSYSRSKTLNKIASFSLDILGASSFMWNTKHNIVHHTYTNIDGVDDDINAGILLRINKTQKHYKIHKYQHLYFWALYAILYLAWVFYTDYKKYFTKSIGSVPIKKMKTTDHVLFWGFKVLHLVSFVFIPIYFVGFTPWLVGFLIYTAATGIILSVVFQLAHVIEETSFPMPLQPMNKMEDEWALHQLKTTANFATRNKFITWWVGGLNYQIEHHLFPKISHIHYPQISKIIKETCNELGVPYIEHKRMRIALLSHIKHIKLMGDATPA
jgi:linoleoyl-CoA desaturase